jgi:hypothetical protein
MIGGGAQMSKKVRFASILALVFMITAITSLTAISAVTVPKFPSPILITCSGQTPGSLTLMGFFDAIGIKATHDSMILPSKMGGFKTLVMVMGASLKGLGAAGIDQDEEMERDLIVLKKAKDTGMKIVLAHIEGTARRNAIADKFITPFIPMADFLLVLEESNEDKLFTTLSEKHKIPLLIFKEFSELTGILEKMFK